MHTHPAGNLSPQKLRLLLLACASYCPERKVEDSSSHRNPIPFCLGKQGSTPLGVNIWLLPNHGLQSSWKITWVFGILERLGREWFQHDDSCVSFFSDSEVLLLGRASRASLSFPQGQGVHWSMQNVFLIFITVVPRAGQVRQESS